METIKRTEIEGIEAGALLAHLEKIQVDLSELRKAGTPKPDTVLITRQEVAKILNISLPTLHAWTKKNILRAYRIGNKVRYKKAEVFNALQAINPKNGDQ